MKESKNTKEKTAQRLSNPSSPTLLTLKGAAKELNISLWAMRTRVWNSEIPAVRFKGARKLYIDREDLKKMVEQNKYVSG